MDSDSDLDLPPPKPTTAIALDDSDDDMLPPPRKPAAAAAPAAAKRAPAVNLDDDDDLDLPPPASAAPAAASSSSRPVATARKSSKSSPNAASPPTGNKLSSPNTKHSDPLPPGSPTTEGSGKAKLNPLKVYKEGYLFKQQPSWPYSNQKRYCVIKNCRLFYFDSPESMKQGKPQGVVELANAKLTDPGSDAKLPNSFGIRVGHDPNSGSDSSNKKVRTFIFSVMHAHEFGEWKSAIRSIVGIEEDKDEVHWFDKLVQGVY